MRHSIEGISVAFELLVAGCGMSHELTYACGLVRVGMPIALKDIYDTKDVVTAGGCYGLRDRVPAEDAHSVAQLRAAGAVFVGKAYTVEFASGGLLNPQYRCAHISLHRRKAHAAGHPVVSIVARALNH